MDAWTLSITTVMKAVTYFIGARIIPATNKSIVIHFISPISILNFKLRAKIPIIEAYVIESENFSRCCTDEWQKSIEIIFLNEEGLKSSEITFLKGGGSEIYWNHFLKGRRVWNPLKSLFNSIIWNIGSPGKNKT